MTCKDCIHYDVCLSRSSYMMGIDDLTGALITDIEKRCKNFKDKCKYIELPCSVGDTVYVIKNNIICAKDIVYYNKIHSRVAEQNEEYWHCVDKDRISINVITFYPENIGQTVFLTKSEAEKAIE